MTYEHELDIDKNIVLRGEIEVYEEIINGVAKLCFDVIEITLELEIYAGPYGDFKIGIFDETQLELLSRRFKESFIQIYLNEAV